MSKGEILIEDYLRKHNILYEEQYGFIDLKADNNRHKLKFDFAIFIDSTLHCLIEFDGKQHSQPVEFFGGDKAFETLQENDNKKNEYCKNNGYYLIRIPYEDLNNINDILNKTLKVNYENTVPSLIDK